MINEFAACLQLFAGLNLGYSGFTKFRDDINSGIEKLIENSSFTISQKQERINRMANAFNNNEYTDLVKTKAEGINNNHSNSLTRITTEIGSTKTFYDGFRPFFISSAFSCLILLVGGGYEATKNSDIINLIPYTVISLASVNFIIFTFLTVKSWLPHIKYSLPISFMILGLTVLLLKPHFDSFIKESAITVIALVISVLPYANLILRGIYFRIKHTIKIHFVSAIAFAKLKRIANAHRILSQ